MLSDVEKRQFLRDVLTFKSLSEEQFDLLTQICEDASYETGETIFKQGEVGGAIYIVVSGQVLVQREVIEETSSVSLNIVKPHQYFGEMTLFHSAPYSVTASALDQTDILRIPRESFVEFARQHPNLLIELNQVLSQRLIEAYDKISELTRNRKPRELRKLYDKLDF
ncbi:MAG TPA: hypothetical protein DEH22_15120 [Chloroflexi bacterium]|nr:hypothetical protein [Chloroflexota bacterium]